MLKPRLLTVASVVLVAGLLTGASTARGNAPHTTYFTFSAPFALPGISLPGGTYMFEVVSPSSNTLVRVTSRDGRHVYLTTYTRTVDRPSRQRADLQLLFNEVPAGTTPSVRAWYPLGDPIGHEFIYPSPETNR
jgi:hypothetical protein